MVLPDAKGNLTLSATNAQLHGSQLQLESQGGLPDIGYWDSPQESVSWTAAISKAGVFKVSATLATPNADACIIVEAAGEKISGQPPMTGGWEKFQTTDLGQIQIKQPGDLVVTVRAKDSASWKAINLNSVQLTPAE